MIGITTRHPALRAPRDELDAARTCSARSAAASLLLAVFAVIESRVAEPMFHLRLFRIRAFTAGNIASLLMFLARGGLQFILIIWLQGIWLPEHGYSFAEHAAVGRASTCCRWSAAC